MKTVLTIAGSDSGAGAGIQADLKAIAASGAYATTAITALTAQNTRGVFGVHAVPPSFITQQIDTVMEDIGADAWKTGMLAHDGIIKVVAERARHYQVKRLVVDPVMIAKGGDALLEPEARGALIAELLPLAYVVTPNHHEAQALSGVEIQDLGDMREAAKRIHDMGPTYVVVKGGHLPAESDAIDIWYDGRNFGELHAPRFATVNTHGTGCSFASALAGHLAQDMPLPEALQATKDYISRAIQGADALQIGHGHGPLDHFLAHAP